MSSNATEAGVIARREGSTLIVAIDRPRAGNSIDLETARAIDRALDEGLAADGLRSVVVTGAGERFFCTGGDIKRYRAFTDAASLNETFDTIRALLARIEAFEVPVIAAIDGYALGGGVELALACDLRIAGPGARLGLPQAGMGIVPGWDGIERLVRTVGRSAAMKLLLGADQHDAHSACALGLVDIACDTGTALDAALAFALSLDDKSRDSIIEIKRLVRASVDTPGEIRALTREAFARLWFGPDHRAAQSAAARR